MTDQDHLERAYRRLLGWYPRDFRRENEQEILAVLMADAPEGKHRPGLAQSADLIRGGLWLRLRPSVPRSARTVRAAVKVMYAGAAVSTASLIIFLALIADIGAYHAILGYHLTAAQASQALNPLAITVAVVIALVPVGLWVWMARETGRGRNWARHLSGVLFGLATLFSEQRLPADGDQYHFRPRGASQFRPGARPDHPLADLAGRAGRGMAAMAPGLHHVFQAAGLHPSPAPGADGRARPSGADGRTRAVQGAGAAFGVREGEPRWDL